MSTSRPILQTNRIVVSRNPRADHMFLNVPTDNEEGTLCRLADARIPLQGADGEPYFGEIALHLNTTPRFGTEIACTVLRGERDRFYATAWTTAEMWDAAMGNYIVVQYENGRKVREFETEPGILDISRRFPSMLWEEDGTIWRDRAGVIEYKLLELYIDPENDDEEYDAPPSNDPRIPQWMLPEMHQHHSVLPRM